ncbi:hypothetical protein J4405_02670 [Candidatus Woesearchaeota archaeon]|nr:hypothetical protein [Candidatus Woesearchaeota archaeon]
MLDIEIIEEKPVTKYEVKEFLDTVKKRDKELSERALKTHDNLLLEKVDYKKVKEEIEKLQIPRLKDRHVVKIIDIMPKDLESVNALFVGENITLSQENMQKILTAIKK